MVFTPQAELAKSLARNPLAGVSAAPALISLLRRKTSPVLVGKDASVDGKNRGDQIEIIQFDAVLNESHQLGSDVTFHPVEDGAQITDHIRKRPDTIQIDGIVSGTPIKFLASFRVQEDPVSQAYETLRDIMEKSTLVDVVTTLRVYQNMALTSVSITRDADSGNILNASLTLQEVRIVKQDETAEPVPENGSRANKKKTGTKPTGEASAAAKKLAASFFLKWVGAAVKGVLGAVVKRVIPG